MGGEGGGCRGSNLTLRNVDFLLCILLLTKLFFYCQRGLWLGDHIDTDAIGFLNDSGCIFVKFVLHCSLRLPFEERKKDIKIGND